MHTHLQKWNLHLSFAFNFKSSLSNDSPLTLDFNHNLLDVQHNQHYHLQPYWPYYKTCHKGEKSDFHVEFFLPATLDTNRSHHMIIRRTTPKGMHSPRKSIILQKTHLFRIVKSQRTTCNTNAPLYLNLSPAFNFKSSLVYDQYIYPSVSRNHDDFRRPLILNLCPVPGNLICPRRSNSKSLNILKIITRPMGNWEIVILIYMNTCAMTWCEESFAPTGHNASL